MPPKRKTRNLPNANDKERINQMSFFEPVYQNDNHQMDNDGSDSELSANGLSRQRFRDKIKDKSNETLDVVPMTNSSIENETNELFDQDQSSDISMIKIVNRIKQIQYSLQQAQQMLESMEKFKHLVPGTNEQSEKLRVIITNLEEQKAGYVNLLNLITLTNEEQSELIDTNSTSHRPISTNTDDQSNEDDDDEEDNITSRRHIQSPVRPRIESKIGFTPQPTISVTPTVPPTINSSDNEQNNRNDNSNYDSLVGSLKSDTINWKDQQLTSDDEASDVDSEKEIQRNLMLQKEQLRALQGQKRALLAIKKRSEQRLVEQQQQQTTNKKPTTNISENDLLSDINNLRERLKLLRSLYEQKHQVETQQIKNSSSKKSSMPNENRFKNLQHVRGQLDELEKILTYYQLDLINNPHEEEQTTIYEETSIPSDDAQRLKTLIMQQRQQTSSSTINTIDHDDTSKPLDKLSNELAAKRLELEQAKTALNRLQQMVKKIEPDECSSSIHSTPTPSTTKPNNYESNSNPKPSLLSSILSTNSLESKKPTTTNNSYADAKMAAQHREIERLVESRQRLHTLKDQIATLHQNMTTPPIPSKKESTQVEASKSKTNYEISPKNVRVTYPIDNQEEEDDDDNDSELYRFECESGDGEEIDDEIDEEIQPRIKQGNFHAPEDIVAEHEQHLLTKQSTSNDELSVQMRNICQCLSSFIQEQKSFNRHIEEHILTTNNRTTQSPHPPTISTSNDPIFNQLQQQVVTQGLIVNLNTAYREIAVLQSEINALQSENTRLTSSLSSYDGQYHYRPQLYSRDNSKDSIYSLDQIKPIRPKFTEQNQILTNNNNNNNKFENSSKTSFNSQSTGKQTAIHCEKNDIETTPIKHERNTTFTSQRLSSPKPVHLHSKENQSKSFVIRRRPISNDNEPNLIQSQLFNYNQKNTFDIDDDDDDNDDDDDDEQQHVNDLSKTIFNIQPSAYYTSTTHDLDNIDVQTLDLQIKSIMVQLIPFMRLHINDRFNQTILNHIRERIIFLFKQQPDSTQLIRQFQNQFSESLGKTIEKYCGATIRDCANDLIRDISDVVFEEFVKYKLYESTNNNSRIILNEQISSIDDGDNENKYQIELAESENRPLNLIGSDEEDNDSDQEENKDSELETAVSRQESNLNFNDIPSSTELHSNGHEYVLVNRSTSNTNVITENNDEIKNENVEVNENENSSIH